jgi:hypothetical protein
MHYSLIGKMRLPFIDSVCDVEVPFIDSICDVEVPFIDSVCDVEVPFKVHVGFTVILFSHPNFRYNSTLYMNAVF